MLIDQNVFYILIMAIAVIGLIVVLIWWRRVNKTHAKVQSLNKPLENQEIEGDLEAECKMDEIVLPKNKNEKFNNRKEIVSNSTSKEKPLNESNEQLNSHEAKKEYEKLQKLLIDMEEKEKELEKKTNKYKKEKHK
jgi:FtsZ-interacting cell division protein ZipA